MREETFRRIVTNAAQTGVPFLAYAHSTGYTMMRITEYKALDTQNRMRTYKTKQSSVTKMRKEIERMRVKYPTCTTLISAEFDGQVLTIQKGDEIERVDPQAS